MPRYLIQGDTRQGIRGILTQVRGDWPKALNIGPPVRHAERLAVYQGQATIDNPLIDARKTWMTCRVVAQLWELNTSVINRS